MATKVKINSKNVVEKVDLYIAIGFAGDYWAADFDKSAKKAMEYLMDNHGADTEYILEITLPKKNVVAKIIKVTV